MHILRAGLKTVSLGKDTYLEDEFTLLSYLTMREIQFIDRDVRIVRTESALWGQVAGGLEKLFAGNVSLRKKRGRNLDEGKVEKAVSVLREPVVEPEHPTGEWNSRRRRKRVTTCFTLRVTRPRPSPPKQIYITRH